MHAAGSKDSTGARKVTPIIDLFVKAEENWQFFRYRYRHIVLNRIQCSQDKIEDAQWISQLSGQLLNDDRKAV